MIVRRVGPVSCAKVAGVVYAILGLVFGGVISLVALAGMVVAGDGGPRMFPGMFGAAAVVVLPVLYGCLGFVMTLILAALYNLVAAAVGGIEVDLQ